MAYPLILLGAGSAYDSIDIERYSGNKRFNLETFRPPLTYQLFDHSREVFQKLLDRYSRVDSLAGEVLSRLEDKKETFEEILQDLLDHHRDGIVNRQERVVRELISLNYYLSDLLFDISNNFWTVDNNYTRLINTMHNRLIKSYVVNFNYDLLFERSASKDVSNIDSYIKGDIKILKIHGACNWVHEPVVIFGNTHKHAESYFADNADQHINSLANKTILVKRPENYLAMAKGQFGEDVVHAFLPALALPFNKKTQYVCPLSHVEDFDRAVEQFDRVIIIGWRGTDEFISNKLKEKLGEKKLLTFVITHRQRNGGGIEEIKKEKEAIKKQYGSIPQLVILDENIYLNGFSTFMRNNSNYVRLFENLPAIMS